MTILRHCHIVTLDDDMNVYPDGYIVFDTDGIHEVGAEADIPAEYHGKGEDMGGDLLLPGFVNLHTHMGMVPFRSLADDYKDRLRRFLIPLEDAEMTGGLAVASSRVAMSELLLGGTTSALDMYFFEDRVAEAAESMGFRLWAGETFRDDPSCDAKTLEESLSRLRSIKRSSLVTPLLAPHAPYSLSLDSLHFCYEAAVSDDLLWTMHLEEMPFEMEAFSRDYGRTPVEVLSEEGLLDSRLIAAHVIFPTMHDLDILAERGVKIAHCPAANAKSGKGISPITDALSRGITVSLGSDGPSSSNSLDMFNQLRLVPYLQKNRLHDRSVLPAIELLPLTSRNAGIALGSPIGQLRAGYKADLQVLSLARPNMYPCYDPYSVVVYSAGVQNVRDVYVDGVMKVKDGRLYGIDFDEISDSFRSASAHFEEGARRLL